MRLPGILPSGAQSRQVMSALDLFPTLAAAAAVKPLNKHPFDGRNLWKQLSSATAVDREDLFFAVGQASVYHAVFHGPWKLVLEQKQGAAGPENFLFRIAEDPNETTNLASSFPAVVKDLAARIEAWKRLHPAGGVQFSNKPPDGWKAPAQWAEAAVGG
jgi:arylsulfatase A-like enzyme